MIRQLAAFARGLRAVDQQAKNTAVGVGRLLHLAMRAINAATAQGRRDELEAQLEVWVAADPASRTEDNLLVFCNRDGDEEMIERLRTTGLNVTADEARFLEALVGRSMGVTLGPPTGPHRMILVDEVTVEPARARGAAWVTLRWTELGNTED